MKFYNPFKINEDRLKAVEERLTKFSTIIQGDLGAVVDLTAAVGGLEAHVERLHLEVGELRQRQQALRQALSDATKTDATRTDLTVDDND